MKTAIITAAVAMALALPATTVAQPWHDRGQPHSKAAGKGHPHGMPPGQAKKRWSRGQHIPRAYVTEQTYYITEPARYRLRPPPAGYQWVRVDNDVYLAQTQTGLIAEVVLSLFD
ncbi:RcnB family protein [Phenylobacterium sp.]|uniref:RcnB family protein n=1 Tax=Phenylobacterium sp. TaxID=1871053 RepID=UPI002731ECDE|nr:RcnB family protein [Phenylobacterium sp.]MDP2213612.1 RcnB family protein [Phenylobacterium sp.]